MTLLWDLRLLGIGLKALPVSLVWRRLIPWITVGAILMVGTGLALFYAKPLYFWGNVYFRVKLVILALAGLNVLMFHFGVEKRIASWDTTSNHAAGCQDCRRLLDPPLGRCHRHRPVHRLQLVSADFLGKGSITHVAVDVSVD